MQRILVLLIFYLLCTVLGYLVALYPVVVLPFLFVWFMLSIFRIGKKPIPKAPPPDDMWANARRCPECGSRHYHAVRHSQARGIWLIPGCGTEQRWTECTCLEPGCGAEWTVEDVGS